MYVLICRDFNGHGWDICVVAVSENRYALELMIDEKMKDESYKGCEFRIYDAVHV